jgi:hypothetical protein
MCLESMAEDHPVLLATHSDRLLDALREPARSVRICEADERDRTTRVRELDETALNQWLEDYRGLGDLRSAGYLDVVTQQLERDSSVASRSPAAHSDPAGALAASSRERRHQPGKHLRSREVVMVRFLRALTGATFLTMLATSTACSSTIEFEDPDNNPGTGGASAAGGTGTGNGNGPASSSASGLPTSLCTPLDKECTMAKSSCIALVENAGKDQFTLRMAQLDVATPPSFATGIPGQLLAITTGLGLSQCNLDGIGTFNLLLEFNKSTKKLRIGGAKPVADPTEGYSFLNTIFMGQKITPLVVDVALAADGTFTSMNGGDVVLPVYFGDMDANPGMLLPLHQALISGKLTDNNNCIGVFNAAALDPANDCKGLSAFKTAAALDGFIGLEEADAIIIDALQQSLCVTLSNNEALYGDNGMPAAKCKRTAGVINFKGDWCTATNTPAGPACSDAVKFQGKLAASAVRLN